MSSVLVRSDAQDRIGVEPQHLVDTRGEQHQQMPHSRGEIDSISARRVGFHDLRGFAEPVRQIRPRLCQVHIVVVDPADSAASAIENGSHAIGFFGVAHTFPRSGRP